ncbi:unnamed protein product [Cuscuta europaea]|uniref:GTD-binding domain-containing protein n=1 Tax=Cuscuta europaea TaxID=41803 RepID=A0A9P0ZSW9_CUSEU|nr:unnamed protein product [Cuscuta europaea]
MYSRELNCWNQNLVLICTLTQRLDLVNRGRTSAHYHTRVCWKRETKENDENNEEEEEEKEDGNGEDKVFDVFTLRKMVKSERRKAKCAEVELEKERMASGSAAEEAMDMILHLQKDNTMTKRWLQWLVSKQEMSSESVALEDKLGFGGQT